jgi:hypothetical protein
LEVGDGGPSPEIFRRRGPHQSRYERARVDARSLRLPQRIVSGFVQALDFVAVEALVPNLQPRARLLGVGGWRRVDCDPRNEARFSSLSGRDEAAAPIQLPDADRGYGRARRRALGVRL